VLRMLLSVLLTLGLAQSQSDRGATPASSSLKPAYEIADAYDVYAAVLPKDWMLYGKPAKQLIVQQETYPAKMCLEPEPESGKLIGEAIEDYKKQNERMWFLQRKFKTDKPYVVLSSEAFMGKNQGRWEMPAFPDSGGYFLLSAVGFNSQRTVAVVWVEQRCGRLCGKGEFHVLQKTQNEWATAEVARVVLQHRFLTETRR